ncbi:MAG: type II toxin-antitoxin system VapC family toxin [Candidatus Lokiarchaeota archaeon]|nr:type II toxin-antitoxin system VapC family toxin [Candidatus Lokiarchaeota archaeon]
MKCLDSDIIIGFLRGKAEFLKKMKELENEALATTTINTFELLYGAKISNKSENNLEELKKLLNHFTIFPFDLKSSHEASSIFADLRKIGHPIGIKDILIAGICRSNNLELITENIKHFKNVKELKIKGLSDSQNNSK